MAFETNSEGVFPRVGNKIILVLLVTCFFVKLRLSFLCFQNIGESEMPSVLNQLLPMIKSHNNRKEDDYNCEDFLILLVYIYSVVGEVRAGKALDEAEGEVKKALVQAFCDEPELSSLLQKITGEFFSVQ